MKVSIIGTGSFATTLGKALQANNSIIFGSRTPEEKQEWVKQFANNTQVVTQKEAIDASDVLIIALQWANNSVIEFIAQFANGFNGKIIIDATNVLQADYSPLRFPDFISGAAKIQSLVPDAKVVKAFNSASGFSIDEKHLKINQNTVTGFYCGDDEQAKSAAAALLLDAGFEPLDSGDLKNAAHLESLGQFMISLAFEKNYGVNVGWKFLQG